ncbi:MAG: phytanoyl-CoA dioxygenase family protein [Wenzhouxiangellaceae bacterium]|nr:phytanoyl-CoA dioxygenase family protein [Wenzhouxiangellaceae bacterium]
MNVHEPADWLQVFWRDGFVVLPGLCEPQCLRSMKDRIAADLESGRGPVEYEAEVGYPGAPATLEVPGGRTVRRLRDALGRDPVFREWACCRALLDPVRSLLGSHSVRVVRAHHNCIMTKQPEYSSATAWHQDIRYWSFQRPDLINVWTALGHESQDNGGMRLIPGSHRLIMDDAVFDRQRFFRDDRPSNQALIEQSVQADLAPGDVLLFHAALLHSAGRNRCGEQKLSVVFSYRRHDNLPLPGSRSAECADLDPESA